MTLSYQLPILYSFRRCPYAMRARLALRISGVRLELREVALANKPAEMLASSPKGTVPVLVLPDETVIDESRDIMRWALTRNDPDRWLYNNPQFLGHYAQLVERNDGEFKSCLDRYKYAIRFPEHPVEFYRQQGEIFLQELETLLTQNRYLLNERLTIADMALFPFVRQFAHVDKDWFYAAPYKKLQYWLDKLLATPLFDDVMRKYKPWEAGDPVTVFN